MFQSICRSWRWCNCIKVWTNSATNLFQPLMPDNVGIKIVNRSCSVSHSLCRFRAMLASRQEATKTITSYLEKKSYMRFEMMVLLPVCAAVSGCSQGLSWEGIANWGSRSTFRPLPYFPNALGVATQSSTMCPWDLLPYSAFSTISKILWGRNAFCMTCHVALPKWPYLTLFMIDSVQLQEPKKGKSFSFAHLDFA